MLGRVILSFGSIAESVWNFRRYRCRCKSSHIVDIIFRLRLRDVHSLEITESIVEQSNRIFIIIRVLILHHHADQLHAVLLRTGDQGASRHIGITGLTSYQVGICVFPPGISSILLTSMMSSGCLSDGRMCSMCVMVILHNASLAKKLCRSSPDHRRWCNAPHWEDRWD